MTTGPSPLATTKPTLLITEHVVAPPAPPVNRSAAAAMATPSAGAAANHRFLDALAYA
jgi:hypothetical protein